MELTGIAAQTLLSPVILFFLLGLGAGLVRSGLSIPAALSKSVALYLMMAIGFKGGAEVANNGFGGSIILACLAAAAFSAALPLLAYVLLRLTTRLDTINAAAVAAHYGSVSVVTFAAALAVLQQQGMSYEPYIVALVAVMEAPAILTGLVLARRRRRARSAGDATEVAAQPNPVRQVLLHGSVVLLLGSFVIGWITGPTGYGQLSPLLVAPFQAVLCIFLLDMGLVVARRAADLRALSLRVAAFGLYMPLVGGSVGLGLALLLDLSVGGATLLAVLGASASYIVVPAVMRAALTEASPAISLALALCITFPFNLVVGIPLYHAAARALVPDVVHEERVDTEAARPLPGGSPPPAAVPAGDILTTPKLQERPGGG